MIRRVIPDEEARNDREHGGDRGGTGPGDRSEAVEERQAAAHLIVVTRQDNGEIVEEIAHSDWVETVEPDGLPPEEAHEAGAAADGVRRAARGPGRRGRPAPFKPERVVSADPAPDPVHPAGLEDPSPGTLPPVADPPTGRRAR